jgi:hypothetical protein
MAESSFQKKVNWIFQNKLIINQNQPHHVAAKRCVNLNENLKYKK